MTQQSEFPGTTREDAAAPVGTPPLSDSDELSLFSLLIPLVRNRRLIMLTTVAAVAVGAALLLVLPKTYTASTSFSVESNSSGALGSGNGLAALAGQVGLAGLGSSGPTPDFFVAVVTSREVLEHVLRERPNDGSGAGTYLEALNVRGDDTADSLANGVKKLRGMVGGDIDRRSGVITVSVTDRSARRAAWAANALEAEMNQFIVLRSQFQSRRQRQFAESRLEAANGELAEAQRRQLDFLVRNRTYQQAPVLLLEYGRLIRQVDLKQGVVITLTNAYEQARVNEARDLPAVSVVDAAIPPVRRASPRGSVLLGGGLLLGLLLGSALAIGVSAVRNAAARGERSLLDLKEAINGQSPAKAAGTTTREPLISG